MILSSKSLDSASSLRATICIVGAGAAGITLASELDGGAASVVVLETGGVRSSRAATPDHYEGTASSPHPRPALFRRCGLGGSTTIWGGRCVPYDPIDFERRDYVANSGWPISYQEIAKHYPQAMQYCDAGAFDFSVQSIDPAAAPLLPGSRSQRHGIKSDVIERYSLPTDFGKRYRARLQRSSNVRIITDAHTVRLIKEIGGARIVASEFVARNGQRLRVQATVFVICAGGIETPRLLLASDPEVGLGNQSDCVGRFYMCHVEGKVGVLESLGAKLKFDFEKTQDQIYCRRKLQIDAATQRARGILNTAFRLHYPDVSIAKHGSAVLSAVYLAKRSLIPEYRRILQHENLGTGGDGDGAGLHLQNVLSGLPQLASFSADWLTRRVLAKRKLPYVLVPDANGQFPLEFNSEQTPRADSRVNLGTDQDNYGMRRVHIEWRVGESDIDSICSAYHLLRDGIRASGIAQLNFDDAQLRARIARAGPVAGHHIGTARMAASASRGVVDTNCAVFGLPNLYVASAAVFPTSSHANPTLTIVALAIRLANHLKATLHSSISHAG